MADSLPGCTLYMLGTHLHHVRDLRHIEVRWLQIHDLLLQEVPGKVFMQCLRPSLLKLSQKLDWPVHQIICKSLKDDKSARPSPAHHQVIYFLQEEENPHFVWLELKEDKRSPT
jgi:hypothetical protein